MNPYILHSQLARAIRRSSAIQRELATYEGGFLGRFLRQTHRVIVQSQIDSLARRLHEQ